VACVRGGMKSPPGKVSPMPRQSRHVVEACPMVMQCPYDRAEYAFDANPFLCPRIVPRGRSSQSFHASEPDRKRRPA